MVARLLKISGLVQGVFFRDTAKAKADALNVTGWVKNCEDGSVEIHAEGSEDALQTFEEWCQKGPPSAEVDAVQVEEAKDEDCRAFEIIL
jgi:acylphosphatase